MTEQTDRTIDAPWRHWNSYHQYVFANYYWQEHYIVLGIKEFEYLWEPDHFAGQVSDSNPNINRDDHVIGRIAYHEPAFTNCGGDCWFILNQDNSGWGRDSGTRHGVQLVDGGRQLALPGCLGHLWQHHLRALVLAARRLRRALRPGDLGRQR